jgi:long-chain acyl-CoA synthetase
VLENARRFPDAPAFQRRYGGSWEVTTWSEYGAAVRRAGEALIASGIEVGDRVAILAYNTPQWVVFDVAAMAIGAVPVGIYFSSSSEEVAEILDQSSSRIVLAGSPAQTAKVRQEAHRALDLIVQAEGESDQGSSWDVFLARASQAPPGSFDQRLARLAPNDPATLIFTAAGTGGSIGAVLTHDNLVAASGAAVELFGPTRDDRVLSYLPLSHIAEQMFTIHIPAHAGFSVAFAQSIGRIRADLPDVKPTIFFSVPLVWSGFERAVRTQIDALAGLQARVAQWSMRVCGADIAKRNAGERRSLFGRWSVALARRVFVDRVKAAIGLGEVWLAFSGAVSVNPSTLEFFAGLDLLIREVYGLSEASGPSVITREGATRFGSVGLPFPGIEMRLAADGEILLHGRPIFAGYLDHPEATRLALRDGWLYTGDLGAIGPDGLLTITGRKKDIVITNGGKNVCPQAIERLLREDDAIADAVVVGDGYDQLGVLVSLDGREAGEDALARAEAAVAAVNQRFARAEQIRRIGLLPRPLSVEDGERNEDGAVVRSVVVERFADAVADLYR